MSFLRLAALAVLAVGSATCWVACGGDDSTVAPQPDAAVTDTSPPDDTFVPDTAPPIDTGVDTGVDAAPEEVIYVNTTDTLYRFYPATKVLARVATFSCASQLVLNLAVNRASEMYGVTSEGLITIDPMTATCFPVAKGVFPRAIGFAPKGTLDPMKDALVGFDYAQYVRIDETTGTITPIGALNPNTLGNTFQVSGDVVAREKSLFITALGDNKGDLMIEVDPKTGVPIFFTAQLPATSVLGLGQWKGVGYGFTAEGKVLSVGLDDGGVAFVNVTVDGGDGGPIPFAGAAVTTLAPPF